MCPVKILIRLCKCADWFVYHFHYKTKLVHHFEANDPHWLTRRWTELIIRLICTLVAHVRKYVFSYCGSFYKKSIVTPSLRSRDTTNEYSQHMFHGEISKMSQIMTKPTKWHVWRVKTDQPGHPPSLIRERLCCPHEESLGPYLHIEGTAKTLFRLGRCPG